MKVGIFFKVENNFIIDAVPVANGEPYGEALQHGGHYEFHEQLRPASMIERRFKSRDYDFYPRGRVVCFPGTHTYRLYVDPCLTKVDILLLIKLFELTDALIETARDEHYRCARCNRAYAY